ncbi:PqqD family protein [Hydrogenoanaerobacterium sp.]|uniref:PqqD family protein n=1 Tax=Hydrogenoanaerobacterium sp. TaxID=2953763 RepID=UPI0028A167CE|nr:PqqD family protein [Hydrogenoanaerobacterium sp.]
MKHYKRSTANYLDYIPKRNPCYFWEQRDDGSIVVKIPHTGFYDRIAQHAFRKPESSRIQLDELGSFIWERIDGTRSVYEIAQEVKERFGENAEPLYNRIITFFGILSNYKFISF